MDLEPSNIRAAFGRALQEARLKATLSQEALSLAAGYDKNYAGMLERGERQPTLETLLNMGIALGIEPEALVSRTRQLLNRGR